LVITVGIFGGLGGTPQVWAKGGQTAQMWLQNAGYIWVPFILASSIVAWIGMDDIASAKASLADQAIIFKRKHNWVMCWLYVGTFGSFIGYSAAFPMLMKIQFPDMNPLAYAFLGPLVGAASRSFSGGLADRVGGGRVTLWVFVVMILGAAGVLYGLDSGSFGAFFAAFMVLFAASGVGNSSTFQMIPAIFLADHKRRAGPGAAAQAQAVKDASKEGAAVLGFTSAIGAFGGFFIPKAFGTSIEWSGTVHAAFWLFIGFYVISLALTWWYYTRRDAEARC
jgi:NNP family nitrate/nitrite transporter-like MFS transporter